MVAAGFCAPVEGAVQSSYRTWRRPAAKPQNARMVDVVNNMTPAVDARLLAGWGAPGLLTEMEREAETLFYRSCPEWLGTFDFAIYGGKYGRRAPLPPTLATMADRIRSKLPQGPAYNTVFVQRYRPGFVVKPHRDPKSNLVATGILAFGAFSDVWTQIHDGPMAGSIQQRCGDLLILPCFDGTRPGPMHSVNGTMMRGIRYTLIVNEVV